MSALTRRDRLCNIIMALTEWPRHPRFTVQTGYEHETDVFGQGRETLAYITDAGLEKTARLLLETRASRLRRDAENRRIVASHRRATHKLAAE